MPGAAPATAAADPPDITPPPGDWAAGRREAALVPHPYVCREGTIEWDHGAVGAGRSEAVFITGASRGIGRHVALHLAGKGRPVVAMARPSEELSSLAGELTKAPIVPLAVDVTDVEAAGEAFERGTSRTGPPDALIACAGTSDVLGPVASVDPQQWWAAVGVDLLGTMVAARAALAWMLPAGRGRIITVYGNLGDRGGAHLSAFAAAKAAVARLTEALASELAGTGVAAIGVHPGFVRTPMTERLA